MTVTAFALAALSLSLQPAPFADEAAAGGMEKAAPSADDQKEVCRYKRLRSHGGERTGARVPVQKVCKTKAEWKAERGE